MPIAFSSASSGVTGSGTSHNISFTVSGTDPLLAVGFFVGSTSDIATGVTWNGTAMTQASKSIGSPNSTYLYVLGNPAAGTFNVTISLSSAAAVGYGILLYTGCSATQPDASSNNSSSSSTSITGTVTTVLDNCWVVMMARNDGGAYSAGASTTIRTSGGAFAFEVCDSNGAKTPPGSSTLTMTTAGAANHRSVSMSIAPKADNIHNILLLGVGT